jgi:hypothetical protein
MSRVLLSLKDVFWSLCRATGREPDVTLNPGGVSALEAAGLLRHFNEGYRTAYEANEWEEAWTPGTLAVGAGGLITYDQVGDAQRFMLFSADPRPEGACAYALKSNTSADGIYVQSTLTTVFGLWLPKCPVFTDVTSEALVVLPSIAPAAVDLAVAEYQFATGQPQTAALWHQRGMDKLEDQWAKEFQRVKRCWWLRNRYN